MNNFKLGPKLQFVIYINNVYNVLIRITYLYLRKLKFGWSNLLALLRKHYVDVN